MSTRSQLRFVQERTYKNGDGGEETATHEAQVYRHGDGYPSGVLPDLAQLKALLHETGTQRGPSYAAADFIFLQKLQGMGLYFGDRVGDRPTLDADDVTAAVEERDLSGLEQLNQPHFLLGYGVEDVGGIHGDEEYLYVVDIGNRTIGGDADEQADGWHVKIAGRGDFPRWDDADGNEFEAADWQFDGTLEDALDEFVED